MTQPLLQSCLETFIIWDEAPMTLALLKSC